jgi:hypothetical protein
MDAALGELGGESVNRTHLAAVLNHSQLDHGRRRRLMRGEVDEDLEQQRQDVGPHIPCPGSARPSQALQLASHLANPADDRQLLRTTHPRD